MPKNRYNLISPLLKIKIEYKIIAPVIIQNTISSIYVTKSLVLKLILNILKTSNKNQKQNRTSISKNLKPMTRARFNYSEMKIV